MSCHSVGVVANKSVKATKEALKRPGDTDEADTDQHTVPLHYAGAGAGGAADPDRGVSRAPHGTRLP